MSNQRIFEVVLKALTTYAPTMLPDLRIAIATSVAMQLTKEYAETFIKEVVVEADADHTRRFDRRLK